MRGSFTAGTDPGLHLSLSAGSGDPFESMKADGTLKRVESLLQQAARHPCPSCFPREKLFTKEISTTTLAPAGAVGRCSVARVFTPWQVLDHQKSGLEAPPSEMAEQNEMLVHSMIELKMEAAERDEQVRAPLA